jgi:hypothetical protein
MDITMRTGSFGNLRSADDLSVALPAAWAIRMQTLRGLDVADATPIASGFTAEQWRAAEDAVQEGAEGLAVAIGGEASRRGLARDETMMDQPPRVPRGMADRGFGIDNARARQQAELSRLAMTRQQVILDVAQLQRRLADPALDAEQRRNTEAKLRDSMEQMQLLTASIDDLMRRMQAQALPRPFVVPPPQPK